MPANSVTLEELRSRLGEEVGVSGWIEIAQETIDQFAALIGDHQWIHVDPQRAAKESPFGSTIAHGFLTLSLLSQMSHQAIQLRTGLPVSVNYGLNRVRFVSPAPAGGRVRGHFAPRKVDGNEVVWDVTVELEGSGKPVLVAEWIVRFY